MMDQGLAGLKIAVVGPLAPPAGGMANQTAQLAQLLRAAGAQVELVQSNATCRPRWLAEVKGVRALCRLLPYLWRLWQTAGRVQLLHVMANSGWSWHLHAAPAIWIARCRGAGVLLNYRGGEAQQFLARRAWLVLFSLRRAHAVVVPSAFLAGVFEQHGLPTRIVPNIIDLALFHPDPALAPAARSAGAGASAGAARPAPRAVILVARHLEPLYDHASALRAFAIVRLALPQAQLIVCGTGSELGRLQQLSRQLGLDPAIRFAGKIDNAAMAALYRQSDLVLNPSLADNMPVSVLEALACGVPVVSTNVGGVPFLLQDGVTGLLVAPGDAPAMAQALLSLLLDARGAQQMAQAGIALAQRYSWAQVAPLLLSQYRAVLRRPPGGLHGSFPGNLYTACISSLLFPLHEMLKRHQSVALRRRMEQSQWWPPQRIEALQLQRLRSLLMHAGQHVPYYRDLYARLDFDPARLRDLRELRRLPLLHKADINRQREQFISDIAPPLQRFNTGGSSGEPLVFFLGKQRVSHDVAAKWRATRWWGVDIGDRETVLWGSPIELKAQDRWRAWRDRFLRTRLLPAFEMSPARLDGYIEQLRRHRPAMLFGYPSALCHLARHARLRAGAADAGLDSLGVKVVFVTGETLYPDQRSVLEAAFGCPVANGYGGRDAGFLAHACPEGGMHITAEDVVIEIVDAQGESVAPGDSGAIVVTHLATGDFPFIRYATGDVGALATHACPCGRGLPLLKRIEGRVTDFLVARDGTVMHGLALIYVLRDLPQISAFKIVQESLTLTRVLIAAADGVPLAPQLRAGIVAQFRARLGAEVDIAIEEVAEIAAEASGKHRYVVSKVVASTPPHRE